MIFETLKTFDSNSIYDLSPIFFLVENFIRIVRLLIYSDKTEGLTSRNDRPIKTH